MPASAVSLRRGFSSLGSVSAHRPWAMRWKLLYLQVLHIFQCGVELRAEGGRLYVGFFVAHVAPELVPGCLGKL